MVEGGSIRRWLAAVGFALGCALSVGAGAQINSNNQGKPTVTPSSPPRAVSPGNSSVTVPLTDKPLTLSDFEGMEPRPELRERLARVGGFIQNTPTDGAAATERTVVWLARTRTALYVVFVCFDDKPELIRSHLARRENILNDDYVSVVLDPFQDRRRGVEFQVNASGVQADAAWTETSGADYSYDQVWDSDGRITKQGWLALVAIPFRSLRFPATGTSWGVVFWRNLPRNSENDWWPRVSAGVSGMLSQEGTMYVPGMEGVEGSHNVQINPVCAGAERAHAGDAGPEQSVLQHEERGGNGGRRGQGGMEGRDCLRCDD